MKIAKLISLLGILAMTGVLVYGFTIGDFSGEGSLLLSMPWGIVSMVDLYVGFTLFSAWIVFRERSPVASIIWVCPDDGTGFLHRQPLCLHCPAKKAMAVGDTFSWAAAWNRFYRNKK